MLKRLSASHYSVIVIVIAMSCLIKKLPSLSYIIKYSTSHSRINLVRVLHWLIYTACKVSQLSVLSWYRCCLMFPSVAPGFRFRSRVCDCVFLSLPSPKSISMGEPDLFYALGRQNLLTKSSCDTQAFQIFFNNLICTIMFIKQIFVLNWNLTGPILLITGNDMVVAARKPDPEVLLFLPLIMFHSLHTLKCLIPLKLKTHC